jgi:hypothetical protein
LRIVAVGLRPTAGRISSPLLMPPWMPPELLVAVCRVPLKPEPI